MGAMFRRSLIRNVVVVAVFALFSSSLFVSAQQDDQHRGRKFKAPPPSSRIEVTVLKDVNGSPVEAAAVIFHPMEGERDKGVMELKTNQDGKAIIDVIPIGDVVRLQVIAKGFQTYGADYKIDKPQMAMEVRLKRPGGQYSIYKQHNDSANSNGSDKSQDKSSSPDKKDQPNSNESQPQTH